MHGMPAPLVVRALVMFWVALILAGLHCRSNWMLPGGYPWRTSLHPRLMNTEFEEPVNFNLKNGRLNNGKRSQP